MATITDVRAWSAPALEEIFDATRQQGDVLLKLDANLGDIGKLSDWESALPPDQPQALTLVSESWRPTAQFHSRAPAGAACPSWCSADPAPSLSWFRR